VAAVVFGFGMPEVVLAAAYHGGQRSERGDVAAQVAAVGGLVLVGLDHHGHGVPADVRADALFERQIAGMRRFETGWNRDDVGGIGRKWNAGARAARQVDQTLE